MKVGIGTDRRPWVAALVATGYEIRRHPDAGRLGDPGTPDTRQHPDPADLVRVARVQALIATTTVVVSEAAARRGEIDAGVIDRLSPTLENAQLAWSRSARRWAEITTPASRTDPALVEAASQLRAAISAAVANQTGWATPEQIAGRIDLYGDRHDPSAQHGSWRGVGLCHP